MRLPLLRSLLLAALLLPLACRIADEGADQPARETRASYGTPLERAVAPPLSLEGSAYDYAGGVSLPRHPPEEGPGLHNLFHLSDTILSGSEPQGREALEELARMGVRTVISVDGKVPDTALAAELGIRYVHIPIQYKGITEDELLRLSKSFRELEAPFYVHCFHGKHRGPAGAAVGRVVLDGLPRDQAIAEMRQYSGTSPKYEGLYRVIAAGDLPSAQESSAYDYEFESEHRPGGVVGIMVELSRAHDNLALLSDRGWEPDPAHPDVDALNEAQKLHQAYAVAVDLPEVDEGPVDQLAWFQESFDTSDRLVSELRAQRAGESQAAERALRSFLALKADCAACHEAYRN